MIAITAAHFMIIVFYHTIAYANCGVIRKQMMLQINKLLGCINDLCVKPHVLQFELEALTRKRISEDHYHEPLVGLSY